MGTVYIDWDVGTDTGTGTTGDPYGNIAYALSQESTTAEAMIYKVRGSTTTAFREWGPTQTDYFQIESNSNTSIVIEPDDGYGWSAGDPQLTIYNDQAFRDVLVFNRGNTTVRGFRIEQRQTNGSFDPDGVIFSSSSGSTCVLENCKVFANDAVVKCTNGSNNYGTIRNCLLANYTDDDNCIPIQVDGFANVRVYNTVLAAGGGTNCITVSTDGDETNTEIKNCVFLDCTTEVDLAGLTASNNATSNGTGTNIGASPVTSVVAGDFESAAIANPRTGGDDFRLASGNTNLKDAGATIGTFSSDMEGTSRPQGSAWDIGYHELAASGPTITDVNTTESWTDGDTGLVITGTNFV